MYYVLDTTQSVHWFSINVFRLAEGKNYRARCVTLKWLEKLKVSLALHPLVLCHHHWECCGARTHGRCDDSFIHWPASQKASPCLQLMALGCYADNVHRADGVIKNQIARGLIASHLMLDRDAPLYWTFTTHTVQLHTYTVHT